MAYRLYILRNNKVQEISITEMTNEELLLEYWSTKDSKSICETAVKTAPSDRSKRIAKQNRDNNSRNFNAIKQELVNRGAKSITRKEIVF